MKFIEFLYTCFLTACASSFILFTVSLLWITFVYPGIFTGDYPFIVRIILGLTLSAATCTTLTGSSMVYYRAWKRLTK